MSAVVTPAGIDPGEVEPDVNDRDQHDQPPRALEDEERPPAAVEATTTPEETAPSPDAAKAPLSPEEQAKQAESERHQRLDALLERWVPNKSIWPQLRELQTPEPFTGPEMPFKERRFQSWNVLCVDSVMRPYYGSMLSVVTSTWLAFATLVQNFGNPDYTFYPKAAVCALVLPLAMAVIILNALHEYPCRIFLYHRLWERKLVVRFKQRTLGHPATLTKMVFIAFCVVGYLCYGNAEYVLTFSYVLSIVQSFGTIGWAVYSSLDLENSLLPMNSAIHHCTETQQSLLTTVSPPRPAPQTPSDIDENPTQDTRTDAPSPGNEATSASTAPSNAVGLLGCSVAKVHVVQEADVKYDILGLYECSSFLGRKLKVATETRDAVAEVQIKEQIEWLKVWATWIGRLGHTKSSAVTGTSSFKRVVNSEMYTWTFLNVPHLYDDELWHKTGSFASSPNESYFSAQVLRGSFAVWGVAILGIEAYGLLSLGT